MYTDVEIGKTMEEIRQLKEEAAKQEHAEPRATLAVHLAFIAVSVIISALTAGAAIPLTVGLALTTFPLIGSELAEVHVIGRKRGMQQIAYPVQSVTKSPQDVHLSSTDVESVLDQTQSVVETALRVGGLDPETARLTAAAVVQDWMKKDGWRLRRAQSKDNISGQFDHVQ